MTVTNAQAGIVEAPREHVLVAAFSYTQRDAPSAQAAMTALKELVRRELAADIDEIDPDTNPAGPTLDTGELGVSTGYDTAGLTITMGLSAAGFGALGITPALQDLHAINWAWFADSPTNPDEGDVVLQVCADSAYISEHVLRRIEHTLAAHFTVTYTLCGEQRDGGNHGAPLTADSARALIGFHDGLSNLNPADPADQALIFIDPASPIPVPATPPGGPQPAPGQGQPGYGQATAPQPIFPTDLRPAPGAEPAWAKDGSYLMVRASLLNLATWDSQTLQAQQLTVGRYKYSGATLDNSNSPAHRHDAPQFAATPSNVTVPPDSHIRRSNPRALPTDAQRRIFRRGYPLILSPTDGKGTLQRGLLFLAYGRSLSAQAEFIMRAWLKNKDFPTPGAGVDPLLALETGVIAGGYYFVPPVADPSQPWNWSLPGLP